MAGNVAEDYTPDSFTVDLTAPEVEIFDIEDKSANNDVVAPGIRYTDINYDADGVTITLEGANNGLVNVGSVTSSIDNGQSIKFNDFAREERMDDLYQLTAKITDLAGNETEEDGSVLRQPLRLRICAGRGYGRMAQHRSGKQLYLY